MKVLFDAPADVEVAFRDGRMTNVSVSFTQAPPLTEVIAAYEKRFGRPARKTLASKVYGTSTVRWAVRRGGKTMTVTLTEHQGSTGIVFEVR